MADLGRMATEIRVAILQQAKRANVGHIGSCLSIADIMAALYGRVLDGAPDDIERDRFILSKGHAALALYGTLNVAGLLADEVLGTYCEDGTVLGGHPEHALPGVELSTGSLGLGLSWGAGLALGARLRASRSRVFVLVSDAELNEGSLWEAVMFAAHHRLANLVAIVDANGQQAFGYTRDVLAMTPLRQRWEAFGWHAEDVDGHDGEQFAKVVGALDTCAGPPHVLIADTTFGKGVSFMESQIEWHYWPMSDEEFAQAVAEVTSSA